MLAAIVLASSIVTAPNVSAIALRPMTFDATGFAGTPARNVEIIGNGAALAEISAAGQLKCFVASKDEIAAFERTQYGGLYHALCDHRAKGAR